MSDGEALRRIRPRTLRDKKFLLWMLVYFILAIVCAIFLRRVFHIDARTRKDLRTTLPPAAY